MARWNAFPHADKKYEYTPATLKKHWARLHRGDCEPSRRTTQSSPRGSTTTRAASSRLPKRA